MKLKNKLFMYHLLIITFTIIGFAVISNFVFYNSFKNYVINKQVIKNEEIVTGIENIYEDEWDIQKIDIFGVEALEEGLILKIEDNQGHIIWNAMEHNDGFCTEMLKGMATDMKKYHGKDEGVYQEKIYNLNKDNKYIGVVTIGYYGPYYFHNDDINFIKGFNNLVFVFSFVIWICLVIISLINSNKLTNPLNEIIEGTKNLFNNNYKKRVYKKSNTKEFDELISIINNLASKLEYEKDLRDTLTTDISHELRTPLTILEGYLEALNDGTWEITNTRLNDIYDEVKRLSGIVMDLDKVNLLENDVNKLNYSKFELGEIIDKQIQNFVKELKDRNINVKFNKKRIEIRADKDKIKRMIFNLISNSIKYSDENSEIEISITSTKNEIKLIIEDHGIGIDQKHLPYIFERFYRVDSSRTKATGGSGIGLSIVKAIVSAHHGKIEVDSLLTKGTKFTITLPNV